jgi:hypothetical protein
MNLVNLGEVNYFLGIEITRNRQKRTITLNQKGYIQRLLNEFAKGLAIKPNPCALGVRLEPKPEKALESEVHSFQQQIGSLMYLMTSTRPDLAFSIGQLARYMTNPHGSHFRALQRVWGNVIGTKTHGLTYKSSSTSPILEGYVDSD